MKRLSAIIVLMGLNATSYAMRTPGSSSDTSRVTDSTGEAVNVENAKEMLLRYAEAQLLDLAHKRPGLFLVALGHSTDFKMFSAEAWQPQKAGSIGLLGEKICNKLEGAGITYPIHGGIFHIRPLFEKVIPNVLAVLAREAAASRTVSADQLLFDLKDDKKEDQAGSSSK